MKTTLESIFYSSNFWMLTFSVTSSATAVSTLDRPLKKSVIFSTRKEIRFVHKSASTVEFFLTCCTMNQPPHLLVGGTGLMLQWIRWTHLSSNKEISKQIYVNVSDFLRIMMMILIREFWKIFLLVLNRNDEWYESIHLAILCTE